MYYILHFIEDAKKEKCKKCIQKVKILREFLYEEDTVKIFL